MIKDERKTKVIFRFWKISQDVIALFPEDMNNGICTSYEHVGQHGNADYLGIIEDSRPATPEEYDYLFRELEDYYGYNLDIRQKVNRR